MTPELERAIAGLYEMSARYASRRTVDGCPCCVSAAERARLHGRPLRALDADDLGRYPSKALTTWGDERDFRWLFPRIAELLVAGALRVNPEIVLGKLAYGKWTAWPERDRRAVQELLDAWWSAAMDGALADGESALSALLAAGGSLDAALDAWSSRLGSSASARALAVATVDRLAHSRRLSGWTDDARSDAIARWLVAPERRPHLDRAIVLESEEPDAAQWALDSLVARIGA